VKYYAQVVSDAVMSDPPMVRGVIDGLTIRRLMSWHGSGRSRVLVFDVIGEMPVSRLLASKNKVALAGREDDEPLTLKHLLRVSSVLCPQCGLEMLPQEFWEHYNTFHARRVNWLNTEDWKNIGLKEPYVVPPEQR
jgi:hypothetical protein